MVQIKGSFAYAYLLYIVFIVIYMRQNTADLFCSFVLLSKHHKGIYYELQRFLKQHVANNVDRSG